MEKLKIIVCSHKESCYIRKAPPYYPLQVGKALHPELDLGFEADNNGDNISERNASWSELTALYWGWKNMTDAEYMGLCHYRRYLDIEMNASNIDDIMAGYDILVAENSVEWEYGINNRGLQLATSQEDFFIFLDTLLEIHPECKKEIIDYFYNSNRFVPFTIFVAKKDVYDDFCEFIFPVLFEVEKRILPRKYTRQKRVMGYFGEWLLGTYILCKHLKIKEIPWVMCGDDNHTVPHRLSTLRSWYRTLRMWNRKRKWVPITEVIVPSDVLNGLKSDGIKLHVLK